MGEVYKARDARPDRTVAIKVLPPALAADAEFRDRFDREARAVSQLDHPRICALYDIGQEHETSFLVMQCLEGETLDTRLKAGALPIDQALKIAVEISPDGRSVVVVAVSSRTDGSPNRTMLWLRPWPRELRVCRTEPLHVGSAPGRPCRP